MLKKILLIAIIQCLINTCFSQDLQINIAVASNFITTTKKICFFFEKKYKKYTTSISSDSTSNLFTKIKNNAPFDIFISADKKHPNIIAKSNFYKNKSYTYAIGYISVSKNKKKIKKHILKYIKNEKFLALSNPKLSPYGKSSKKFILNLKISHEKIIFASNINHTFNFINNNTCNVGITSFSQNIQNKAKKHTYWKIPRYLYPKIKQKAITIKNNNKNNFFFKKIIKNKIKNLIKINGYN